MPPANRKRPERLRSLTPLQAIQAWMNGEFGVGDEGSLLQAIRKDARVTLDDEVIAVVVATTIREKWSAEDCFKILTNPKMLERPAPLPILRRSAVIVRPKRPFVEWVLQVTGDVGAALGTAGKETAYLVTFMKCFEVTDELLDQFYDKVFREELWAWTLIEEDWPRDRDLATFREWFDVEVRSFVMDLCPEDPLEDDELDRQ